MNVIMLRGLLVYCTLLFNFDFYLTGFSIYVYMSDLVVDGLQKNVIILYYNILMKLILFY
jgi:hypothetical protein